jgi:predicted nucleotidyltransferase component of viral defense system
MIDDREIRSLARQRGVPEIQIRRDHLLSHLIGALPLEDRLVFIGGTALHRTHLPDVRLSEDLDVHLIVGKAEDLVDQLIQDVRLEFPGISIISRTRQYKVATSVLEVDELRIQIQVISNRPQWMDLPTATTPVRLRYPDLPASADLIVPTVEAFGAMKLIAYVDRATPRDLFDLKELAERGALRERSLELTRQLLGRSLARHEFESIPTDDQWDVELSHQVAESGTPEGAREIVVHVLAELLGW